MNGKQDSQIGEALQFMQKVLIDTLSSKINGIKFTGQLVFTISCTHGGITSNNGEIKQIIKK